MTLMRKIIYKKTTLRDFNKLKKRYKLGDLSCSYELASYLMGNWKWNQHQEIVRYFKQAIRLGIVEAIYDLGMYYEADDNPHGSIEIALKWLKKAALAGHPAACNSIGFIIEHDFGKKVEAIKWYRMGAERGDYLAQFNLGISYEKGIGIAKDIKKALQYFELAKLQNHPEARYKIRKLKSNKPNKKK